MGYDGVWRDEARLCTAESKKPLLLNHLSWTQVLTVTLEQLPHTMGCDDMYKGSSMLRARARTDIYSIFIAFD